MIKSSYIYEDGQWDKTLDSTLDGENTMVLCFGSTEISDINNGLNDLKNNYPTSKIIGCSTSGEIKDDILYEKSLVVMVVKFEKTKLKLYSKKIENSEQSFRIGEEISSNLAADDLKSIFILSDGLNTNGSTLTKGISKSLSNSVVVTGGLAGDDANFSKTWVFVDGQPLSNYLVAIGFYGDNFRVGYSSQGGWQKFGIDRMVTEAKGNTLYKLDHKPALDVYKTYLGDNSKNLPASGLMYPLMIKEDGCSESKVRTILAINEDDQSITFAGDIPNGSEVMFMKATNEQLINGALLASDRLLSFNYQNELAVSIAISCVGRKLVLGSKIEDELEAVCSAYGKNVEQIGYYSYGELSPLLSGFCDLHNQTMTLTLFWEVE
ncbi:MAG: FIST C-terminal domain-containing protein [Arcobacter sp.]|nr:FIST C-terminal domain-containing protein [Arcobacter sp.]